MLNLIIFMFLIKNYFPSGAFSFNFFSFYLAFLRKDRKCSL
ncbi:hypothetical protein Cabys_4210 [Caldithrix abyssi DSM 13497]|uniref:Uncharacterized protein n=1 Tax=Caldithrix abyssi DSM 13497 TaxID=880073 RepID=A0A1J1CE18_CALAY|nr:hypothetical protein Cabys_4210 [Caldithrix abyssi DSM 13497]